MSRERPILFSGAMVQAIKAGRKTQTRRVIKDVNGPKYPADEWSLVRWVDVDTPLFHHRDGGRIAHPVCPYGRPGDLLVVKENYSIWNHVAEFGRARILGAYEADGTHFDIHLTLAESAKFWQWQRNIGLIPSIYCFRSLIRLKPRVVSVRLERLQDISEEDAMAEGIASCDAFRDLWDSINGERPGCSWADNPWVWAITFEQVNMEGGAK